ncbi:unnamed protein product [Rotaria socialis]|uniref:Uncharacterized protein n=2 Tax=Rotaria socialis TaxID=392032 RepID=A0A818VZQ4_9BILA|nr:unnamed protein product [Rotaria socialis]CAF3717895.1 unnamed protein product [Rotaria socialis]CAF4176622.1 unnamed protein product [Rotaria socialis]CAF4563057.1 unnamed protein product [Rotaria socialis]
MQHHQPIIQLSDHVKSKIKDREPGSFSRSSDELILSDHTNEDNESFRSPSLQHLYRKRSSTFITRHTQKPSIPEYAIVNKRNSCQSIRTPQRQEPCQECFHRQNLIQSANQQLLRAYSENRRLTEQLRSFISLNRQYEEDNLKLKQHLMKMSAYLEEYKTHFNQLKQTFIAEKNNQVQQGFDNDQLRRLRHEMHVCRQVVASKQQEEQKNIDYFSRQQ